MRRFILNYLALDYIIKFRDRSINFVRAANIIVPLFCINGLISIIRDEWIYESIIGIISLSVLLIVLGITFIYLRLRPIDISEWRSLDDSQKWQYSKLKPEYLDPCQQSQVDRIDGDELFYHSKVVFFSNFIVVGVTVVLCLIYG